MIISASRRTDIPAFYADWFFRRLGEGFVCTRNPMNHHQISRIALTPQTVDGIVFWTKNPTPMLNRLSLLQDYPHYFQFTLTPYGKDLEPGVPSKQDVIIPVFRQLSRLLGPERVIWRYDPIVLTPTYTLEYHVQYFEALAKRLSGYTHVCTISFVDSYRHLQKQGFLPLGEREMLALAEPFAEIGRKYDLTLQTCAESVDLSQFGIAHGSCIDGRLLEALIGQSLDLTKDNNQRQECSCMTSIDIGMYDSCGHGCLYCYANHSAGAVQRNIHSHDPHSPLLYGVIGQEDVVKDREIFSCKRSQLQLF